MNKIKSIKSTITKKESDSFIKGIKDGEQIGLSEKERLQLESKKLELETKKLELQIKLKELERSEKIGIDSAKPRNIMIIDILEKENLKENKPSFFATLLKTNGK